MDCSQLGDWATRGLIRGKDMLKAELEASSRSMGTKEACSLTGIVNTGGTMIDFSSTVFTI